MLFAFGATGMCLYVYRCFVIVSLMPFVDDDDAFMKWHWQWVSSSLLHLTDIATVVGAAMEIYLVRLAYGFWLLYAHENERDTFYIFWFSFLHHKIIYHLVGIARIMFTIHNFISLSSKFSILFFFSLLSILSLFTATQWKRKEYRVMFQPKNISFCVI